jgi:alpha-L-fucosidase 2
MRYWLFSLVLGLLAAGALAAENLPDRSLNLKLAAPIRTWDEAVPLGNGLLGGLLWGEANLLRLSLDRGDLWDLRTPAAIHEKGFTYANLQQLVRARNQREISRLFDEPYNQPTPTKIPAGRLEILLDPSQHLEQYVLDLARAEGRAQDRKGRLCTVFFSALAPVAVLRLEGPEPKEIRLRVPGSSKGDTGPSSHAVARLGYPPAQMGSAEGILLRANRYLWFVQETTGSLRYCVCAAHRRTGDVTLVAVTVTSTADDPNPLRLACQRVTDALARGYEALFQPHADWWARFWSQSAVNVPERHILQHYYLVRYFYGAASRRGAPPMPLQGVWTADAGSLPPWKGDYHNDLNTQMTYMGYQGAGHFDEGRSFLDFNWNLLPRYRRFAREFFQTPGANVPGVMSLSGDPLTGWGQYSLSPTMGAWIAHLFYLHWRYTADEDYLKTRAYPWCRAIGQSLQGLLQSDDKKILKLPLSSSPEIHDNSLRAWLTPNSNYDLFSLKMLFLGLAEMAEACGQSAEARDWSRTAAALGDWHLGRDGVLLLDAREELRTSHRHLSNLIGLYPFNLVTVDGGERDRRIIRASLDQWDKLGTAAWCGYSFSWMSALRARVGEAESALRHLDIFVKAFTLRNGFHANGDQTGRGFSRFTYRPFTLEGNMLAAAAVHEMLLQSWSPSPGQRDTEVLRLFPATPRSWCDVSFDNLRAEGGHVLSARRENNVTTWFRIVAGRDGIVRIRDNFGGRVPQWKRAGVLKVGANFEALLKRGDILEARLAKPEGGRHP